jgi:putative membrane protein
MNFDTPQRQSPVAILLVVSKAFFNIIKQLWPVLLLFYLGKSSSNFNNYIIYGVIVISIISAIYSIINYFRTHYTVINNELTLTSGILSSKKITIPADRIQSINLEQNIIHRLFNVQRLKIDTAGSTEKEVEISALNIQTAEALRNILLKNKSIVNVQTDIPKVSALPLEKEILKLSLGNLIKVGFLENHIKSGWIIFVFAWWIYTNLQEVGIDPDTYIEQYSALLYGITILVSFVLLFMVVSVLISLIRTVVKYFNLKLVRSQKGFRITYGLLNTQILSAQDHKIQTVTWSDNLLKRIFKIFDLKLKQASSKEIDTKEAIQIPGCNINQIDAVLSYLYPKDINKKIVMSKVHQSYLNRAIVISALIALAPLITGVILHTPYIIFIGVFLSLYLPLVSYLKFRKLSYGYNDELIRIQGGVFGDKNIVTPIYKIQAIEKTQSPFERKRGLASIQLYNASGKESIPFIPEPIANKIINTFLKKVETDKRKWM